MKRGWIGVFAVVALLLTLASIVTVQSGLGFRGKTLFAWMDILIVPLAVGIGLYILEQLQRSREQNEQRQRSSPGGCARESEFQDKKSYRVGPEHRQ